MSVAVIVLISVLALAALGFVLVFNRLVSLRNRVEDSWSGVDVALKRRHDLVPNLVEIVKGYAAHERETLEDVTRARVTAVEAEGPRQVGTAESALTAALGRVGAVAEGYPQLRASENFLDLQRQLSEIEDEIQAARRIYNSNVQIYNTAVQVLPNSIVAALAGFRARAFFDEITQAQRETPGVSLS